MICVNTNLPGYQTTLKMSGVREDTFEAYASFYLENFGRLPHLDEIPEANSENYIKDVLHVKQSGEVENSDLEQHIGVSSPEEATIKLNKIYSDKLIEVVPISETKSEIRIVDRPKMGGISEIRDYTEIDSDVILDILQDLLKYSGIQIETVSNKELETWENFPNANLVNGFIKDGTIYINTDNATADTPIHELLHIFVGAAKFTNPKLYRQLIDKVIETEDFAVKVNRNTFRTESDLAEESLITEYSKYLTGQNSVFNDLSIADINEFLYQIKRVLDTAIFGDISVKAIPDKELFAKNIIELAKITNSDILENNFINTWKSSRYHRLLNNLKSELLKSGELRLEC